MTKEMEQHIRELMDGAFDLHIHSSPSHVARIIDDVALYAGAAGHGMGGIMIKCHYEPTAARAEIVNRHFKDGKTTAYGSLTLNWPVGGLNPYAAESACRMGARMIWMPTRDASASLQYGDMPGDFFKRPGITVLREDGSLLPVVYEILDVARTYGIPVGTGHLSTEESILLCREGRRLGNKMVLTHPEWERTHISLETQIELAGLGVVIEKCWLNIMEKDTSQEYMMHTIKSLGAEHVYITTDCGKASAGFPWDGYRDMIRMLLEAGFSDAEIRSMCREVPAALIEK